MTGPDPAEHGWWRASRSAGIVALLCITVSVGIGLAMAGRVSRNPRLARSLMALHQQTALIGLVAIAVHGIALLGDRFLAPGLAGIAVPFVIDREPLWTGLGVVGGWLGAALGLSYWIRQRIGAALWRRLHRATVLVYVLSVAHALGAGTDASEPWMRVLLVATGAPIVFLFLMRVLPQPRPGPAFRRFRVAEVTPESAAVTSFALEPVDGKRLAPFAPGQFVTVRAELPGAGTRLRSYSLSSAPDPRRHRISVKRDGVFSRHLHSVEAGDVLELAGPSGTFRLDRESSRPVVLLSAGVGATPVLAMLHALVEERTRREVWWLHGARNGAEHPFREEVRELVERLPGGRLHVRYSRPEPRDRFGHDYHAEGRLDAAALRELQLPADAVHHLCGPAAFLDELIAGLRAGGVPAERIRSERFAAAAPASAAAASTGAVVAFSRSGVNATWDSSCPTLLDLAEANGVAAAAGCRIGSCHSCRTDVLDGSVRHDPEPLEPPPAGSVLLCCARPDGDVVLDA